MLNYKKTENFHFAVQDNENTYTSSKNFLQDSLL